MNVNSRGHNLDKRFKQLFPEIKHPPWVKIPVGRGESVIFRFQSPGTIPIPSGECVNAGVAAVAIGAVVKAIIHLGRFFQTAVYVEMNTPEVSPEIFRPPRLRGFDPLVDEIQKGVVFFPDHLVLPVLVDFCAFRITSAFPGGIIREVSRDDHQNEGGRSRLM
jgi:hypothetical protein